METLDMIVEGLLIPLVASLGLMGNIASVIVLSSSSIDMKTSFCRILTMLAIFDSVFIVSMTVIFSLPELSPYYSSSIHPYIIPWLLPIIQMSLNGSTWSTVSLALERFTSVVVPHYRLAKVPIFLFILPIVILSITWNIPHFFELYTCVKEVNSTYIVNNDTLIKSVNKTSVCPTDLRKDSDYVRDYINIANFVGMIFIPFLLLCILNSCIYKTIKSTSRKSLQLGANRMHFRQRRDQRIAMLLITVVVVFLICNIPKIIVNTYEVFHLAMYRDLTIHWPNWIQVLTNLSHFLLVLNSSINIFLYCWKDNKFRLVLFKMLKIQRPMTPNMQDSTTLLTNLTSKRTPEVRHKLPNNLNMMVEEGEVLEESEDLEWADDVGSKLVNDKDCVNGIIRCENNDRITRV